MHTPIDQHTIDEKIQHFMARKSPWKTFSKTLAMRLTPSVRVGTSSREDITYEPLEWTNTTPRHS